jgi:hypothetical protein
VAIVVGGTVRCMVLPLVFPIPNLTVGVKF